MKKSIKKDTESKAPAKKTVVAVSKAATPVAKAAAPVAKAAPVKETAAPVKEATAPVKKKTVIKKEPPATIIFAKIDIGFGNHLYIRGEGQGLSWDHGIAMDCVGNGLWTTTIKDAAIPVVFKLLVNDLSWSNGADFIAEPGQSLTVEPTF